MNGTRVQGSSPCTRQRGRWQGPISWWPVLGNKVMGSEGVDRREPRGHSGKGYSCHGPSTEPHGHAHNPRRASTCDAHLASEGTEAREG